MVNRRCEELDIRRRICPRGEFGEGVRLDNKITRAHEVVVTAKLAPCNRRLQENNTELTVRMLVGRYLG